MLSAWNSRTRGVFRSRFISRLGDKALPLYKFLKKSDNFVWTEEADAALAQLKYTLTHAPILAAPKEREPLLLYLSATNFVISAVIVVECLEEGKKWSDQRPVYLQVSCSQSRSNAIPTTRS